MHVIATAGHVDHGKSTLVKALTGSDPDRLAEEHDRGLSIELGYCWTSLPGVGDLAFVDVPGHQRFVGTMLSGIGPVPAVLLVVAADDPWMPQAAEHLAALDALGVRHGVVAVTRCDLAPPEAMLARARREVEATSLAGSPVVPVSAVTGDGLPELRSLLADLVLGLPDPDPTADVRLWVDRCFHVRGAGTVVTGTLPAGTVTVGDVLHAGDQPFRVRGVQSLGEPVPSASGVARVALNLAGEDRTALDRHSVLVTPGAWRHTTVVDVRVTRRHDSEPPRRPLLHVGAAAVPAYFRPLGDDIGRLTLEQPVPLRVGDRALLRDPGSRALWGITVLDPAPPELRRRGAGRARASALASHTGRSEATEEVERRGLVELALLRRIGVAVDEDPTRVATPDGWLVGKEYAERLRGELEELVRDHDEPLTSLAARLGLPSPEVVAAVVAPPLRVVAGRVTARPDIEPSGLPEHVDRAVETLRAALERDPFAAPTADGLREAGLDPKGVTLAARGGRLLHLGDGIVLLPGADDVAVRRLGALAQPFTTSEARRQLNTTRRVVLPLLQHLDRKGRTRRHPDDRRSVV